ncbi:MAG: hypothetical protein HRT89_21885 [Lentisphaeria bacterium]|nr:hypothetical protein [Lentisphaeria bacterium]NQZ70714.1 hypothetical protein [Lentisphaeria bacterium]
MNKQTEINGPSAGFDADVESYERNVGSVGNRKITFVGASYKFVHKVLRDVLLVGGFEDIHICLHDLNPVPLEMVGRLLEKIARQKKTNIVISKTMILDDALKGADVVILAINTGGDEADCRAAEVCNKYGIPVAIGDTLGPPALIRNLRTIPVCVDLVRRMEKLCPNAVMLNFTNPMSAITGAMGQLSSIPSWGLCHSADELFSYFSKVFDCDKADVDMDVGGVNHQAFVTKLRIAGVDQTSRMLEATTASDALLEDNLLETQQEDVDYQKMICKMFGVWPSTGHTHLAEFYEYFLTDRMIAAHGLDGNLKKTEPNRAPKGPRQPHPIILEWTNGPEPVGDLHLLTTEHAHELLWSVFTEKPFTRVLNVLNSGSFIQDLPTDACVEALVTVSGKKVTGTPIKLPPPIHSLVQRWTTIHQLSIDAAMTGDRQLACQALFLDPHVREFDDIEPLLDDLINQSRDWLPDHWA